MRRRRKGGNGRDWREHDFDGVSGPQFLLDGVGGLTARVGLSSRTRVFWAATRRRRVLRERHLLSVSLCEKNGRDSGREEKGILSRRVKGLVEVEEGKFAIKSIWGKKNMEEYICLYKVNFLKKNSKKQTKLF